MFVASALNTSYTLFLESFLILNSKKKNELETKLDQISQSLDPDPSINFRMRVHAFILHFILLCHASVCFRNFVV